MKGLYPLLLIIILSTSNCSGFQISENPEKEKTEFYDSCMQTFSDEEKCKTFTEKTYSGKPEEGEIHLSPEEEESLYIRSDLKTEMFGKNTLYLKSKLGDPEDKINLGAGKEVLIYKRPISKYAKGSKPDKQISFVIKRNRIVQIKHIAPN